MLFIEAECVKYQNVSVKINIKTYVVYLFSFCWYMYHVSVYSCNWLLEKLPSLSSAEQLPKFRKLV